MEDNETPSSKEDVYNLLRIYMHVVDANIKKDNVLLKEAYALVSKCFEHCSSTSYLLLEINIPEIPIKYYDSTTPNVTVRAALESLLTFAYIFHLTKNSDEQKMRYLSRHRSGLLDRQEYTANSAEHKLKQVIEKREIEKLTTAIKETNSFQQLTEGEKKRILNGEWRLVGWVNIGIQIGFNEARFRQLYSYLCSYAHSGGLSNMQIQDSLISNQNKMPGSMAEVALPMILAHMIKIFCSLSPHSSEELQKDQIAKELVDGWIKFSQQT